MNDLECQPVGPDRILNADPCPFCGGAFGIFNYMASEKARAVRRELRERIASDPALAEIVARLRLIEAADAAEKAEQRKIYAANRLKAAGSIPRYAESPYVADDLRFV